MEKLAEIVKVLEPYVDAFEPNYSCPNIRKGEKVGIEIGKDPSRVMDCTQAVTQTTSKPVYPKFSAVCVYGDKGFCDSIRAARDGGATGISVINTIPKGMKINIYARRPVLSARYGGVSGPGIKYLGVGTVAFLRENFGMDFPVIGMGGIENHEDVIEYVEAGANAVAIGTALSGGKAGVKVKMASIYGGVKSFLDNEGVTLDELRGSAVRQ